MKQGYCHAPTCSYDGVSSIHRLPKKDPKLEKELLRGLGFLDDYDPPPRLQICRQHFTDDSFITIGKQK